VIILGKKKGGGKKCWAGTATAVKVFFDDVESRFFPASTGFFNVK
jgi:hypothetical protein